MVRFLLRNIVKFEIDPERKKLFLDFVSCDCVRYQNTIELFSALPISNIPWNLAGMIDNIDRVQWGCFGITWVSYNYLPKRNKFNEEA